MKKILILSKKIKLLHIFLLAFPVLLFIIIENNSTFSINALTIETLTHNHECTYQAFYNTGNGYNEADYTITSIMNREDSIHKVKFEFPEIDIKKLRIDPGTKEDTIKIQTISFQTKDSTYRLNAKEIAKNFFPVKNIKGCFEKDDVFYISTVKSDPILEYRGKELASVTSVTIELIPPEKYEDTWQLFYDTGNKYYNEQDSIKKFIYLNDEFIRVTLPFPPEKAIKTLRIDPDSKEETIVIKSITFDTGRASCKLYPKDIIKNCRPLNHIEEFYEKDNLLYIKITGNDPSFEYVNSSKSIKTLFICISIIMYILAVIYLNFIMSFINIIFILLQKFIVFICKKLNFYIESLISNYKKSGLNETLDNFKISPEKIFIFLGLFFGLSIIVITPPFQAPDEFFHFEMALKMSNFNIFMENKKEVGGDYLPESILNIESPYKDIPHNRKNKCDISSLYFLEEIQLDSENETFYYPSTNISPVSHLPQAIGIFIGKMMNLPVLLLLYSGRISNLIFFIIMMYFVIKNTPILKNTFLLLILMPMTIFLCSSLSYDVILISTSFLIISIFLKISSDKTGRATTKTIIILILLSIILSLCKGGAYFLLLSLFFIVPIDKIGSKRKYYIIFILMISIYIISHFSWAAIINKCPQDLASYEKNQSLQQEQIKFILYHPLEYIKVLINTLNKKHIFYLKSFIGCLGWLDTGLPYLFTKIYLFALILSALFDFNKNLTISKRKKIFTGIICLAMAVVLETIGYVLMTKVVGTNVVYGIQGRYFIPFSPLFFLLFYNSGFSKKLEPLKNLFFLSTIILICISMIITLTALVNRYYIF